MASSPLPFPFPPTTTSYRAGAIFKFEMCRSARRHPVLRLYFYKSYNADVPLWHDVIEDIRHEKRRSLVRNVPTYTASHTEDRNHDVKIDHCDSMTDVHMGQNVAKKTTHGIWCMIFPKKGTKMSQPHGRPSQLQISRRKLIEYRSTPAEHKFSEGSVDLFSRGRFITEHVFSSLFCTNKYEKVTVVCVLSLSSTPLGVLWRFRQLAGGVSSRRSGFNPRPYHVGSEVNTVTLEKIFLPVIFRCMYDPINATHSANHLSPMLRYPCHWQRH